MTDRDLTDLQRSWAHAYVGPAKFNASEAARIAGLSEAEGRRMRSKPHVVAYVEDLQRERLAGRVISQDRTLEEIFAIATSNVADVVTVTDEGHFLVRSLDGLPRHITAAIKKIKLTRRQIPGEKTEEGGAVFEDVLEIELHDKVKALALLAQHQGLLDPANANNDHTPAFAGLEIVAPTEEDADEYRQKALPKAGG